MRRLVLDAGPLIALLSKNDRYHTEVTAGFARIPREFGEMLTPLPIVFEVYKFVSREQSIAVAKKALASISASTVIVPVEPDTLETIFALVDRVDDWRGSLEDASLIVIAEKYNAEIWTLDYRDIGRFPHLSLWTPPP
jgi:predicted nucleic acid-binding protein